MIKRILGIIFSFATLAVIVLAAMNFGGYRSMFFAKTPTSVPTVAEQADSLIAADSLLTPDDAVASTDIDSAAPAAADSDVATQLPDTH